MLDGDPSIVSASVVQIPAREFPSGKFPASLSSAGLLDPAFVSKPLVVQFVRMGQRPSQEWGYRLSKNGVMAFITRSPV